MALATRCPYCHTTFRVASDQLKLRGGIVRCGACQRIFDGQAHLVDLDTVAAARQAGEPAGPLSVADTAIPAADAASPSLTIAPGPQAADVAQPAVEDDQPVYTLDFGHTLDPLGILPMAGETDSADVAADVADVADADAAGVAGSLPAPDIADVAPDAADADLRETHADEAETLPWATGDAPDAMPAPDASPPDPVHVGFFAHVDDRPAIGTASTGADADARARVEAAPASAERAPGDDAAVPAPSEAATQHPVTAADDDPPVTHTADFAALPGAAPASDIEASVPIDDVRPSPSRIEPTFGLPVDEELVAQPLPDAGPEPDPHLKPDPDEGHDRATPATDGLPPPHPVHPANAVPHAAAPVALPLRASADLDPATVRVEPTLDAPKSARVRSAEARARRSALTPTRIEAARLRVPATAPADEPEFVKRSRRRERSGKTVKGLLALGAVVLLLLLAAQLVLNFRNELAARQPGLRPVLKAACMPFGCRVDWPAHADNLVIDEGDLAPIGQDAYALNTALHNQGGVTQAWPSIELELVDAARKPVLRRVFGPAEYLPPGTLPDTGFGARSELPVKLNFTLAGVHPASYNIVVFYP